MRLAPCKDAFFKKTSCSEPVYLNTLVSDLLGARRTRPPKTGRLPHPELLAREPSFSVCRHTTFARRLYLTAQRSLPHCRNTLYSSPSTSRNFLRTTYAHSV